MEGKPACETAVSKICVTGLAIFLDPLGISETLSERPKNILRGITSGMRPILGSISLLLFILSFFYSF